MQFCRHLDYSLQEHFKNYKEILILLGPRQSGKTTIAKRLFPDATYLLVDNEPVRRLLETYDLNAYKQLLKNENMSVIVDEIHLLKDPGRAAKIMYDQLPQKLIITGSSSFHIKNKTSESLAGRKIDYFLFPLTFSEYLMQQDIERELNFTIIEKSLSGQNNETLGYHVFDMETILETALIYGLYPRMTFNPRDHVYLQNLVDSLIFKDILELNLIENRRLALDLLKLLSYQIGNLVSYSELSSKLQADRRTIQRYIEIFEQSFLIYRLNPYSPNPRDEIVKSPKIYFYDTGIRNALINDFSPIRLRPDGGALFENFIINEFIKANHYKKMRFELRFWRTKQGAETDLVLLRDREITGIEIKLTKPVFSRAFRERFPKAATRTITMGNFY